MSIIFGENNMACILAQGSTLTITNSGGSPVAIGDFISWDGLAGSVDIIDCTDLSSTAKEKKPGLQDFGSFTAEVKWGGDDAGQQECLLARAAQDVRVLVLKISDTDATINTATFSAFVVSIDNKGATSDKVMRTITFEVTGAAVWSTT